MLARKPEGKRPLGSPSRWEYNIKMGLEQDVRKCTGFIRLRIGSGGR